MKVGDLDFTGEAGGILDAGTTVTVALRALYLRFGRDTGNPYVVAKIEPISEEDPDALFDYIYYNLYLPTEDSSKRQTAVRVDMLRKFCNSFDIPYGDVKDWILENQEGEPEMFRVLDGHHAQAVLDVETWNGEDRNSIKRFL